MPKELCVEATGHAKRNLLTHAYLSAHIVPILFGVPTRASSYRPHLTRMLRAEGYTAALVGHACKACAASSHEDGERAQGLSERERARARERDAAADGAHACADEWLRWHGCDDIAGGERSFLGFWGWSSRHVLQGHPSQPHRGALADWLRPADGLHPHTPVPSSLSLVRANWLRPAGGTSAAAGSGDVTTVNLAVQAIVL